ncbi:MAG: ATP-binding cassette domain-containing protein [Gaiellales bacterium]
MTLGPGAALAGWASILVALNVTGHPLVAGATFIGLVVLARRAGLGRLIVLALVIGAMLLLVVPGMSLIDGSFQFSFRDGAWQLPSETVGWLAAVAGALRIPTQVLAVVLLAIVPARLLLAATSRVSPGTALLGGLATRLRPLLVRDATLVRDELASRGLRIGRGAPFGERARGLLALWEAIVSGMLDRAIQTAATLETRGYGTQNPNMEPLAASELSDGMHRDVVRDRLVLLASIGLVIATLAGRANGTLIAPSAHSFGEAPTTPGAAVLVAAMLGLAVGLIASLRSDVVRSARSPVRGGVATANGEALTLVVDEVSMRYPDADSDAVSEASLRVAPGELVVLTGASGSGKSTLLDVVTGVAPRTTGGTRRGSVRLGAHVLGAVRGSADARIAAVYQEPEGQVLVGHVAEEIAFGLRHAGVATAQIEQRVFEVLDQLNLRGLAQRDCGTLSGGELQRVLLAAALVLDPALLVLDEPTSQIDAASERRFWTAVDVARRERGIGVLVAEHRLDHVSLHADRVLVFTGGRLTKEVPATRLAELAPELLADAYAGLVPHQILPYAPIRLSLRFDRIDVGDERSSEPVRTLMRGFSCAIPGGAIVTLEGENGTGKSTLLRAIRGLHPSSGGVQIDGQPRGKVGDSVRRFGFLSQSAGALLPGRTVQHAIEDTCRRLGIDVRAAHEALAGAGLSDRLHSHPSELSVGERQRLALVTAVAHRPTIWLLDEPTRGMDAIARRWVASWALAHAAAGGVVIVATHDPLLAAAIATHRLRLDLRTGPSLIDVPRDSSGRVIETDPSVPRSAPSEASP